MTEQFIEIEPDGLIVRTFEADVPPLDEGNTVVLNPTPFTSWPANDHQAAYFIDGEVVIVDGRTLAQARAEKIGELSAACEAHILGGFVSSALGEAHAYPSTLLDQHNLNGLVTRSLYPTNPPTWSEKFWCADAAGVWARREHTAGQLQQVGDEAITRITAAQAKCDGLISRVATSSIADLGVLTWDSM